MHVVIFLVGCWKYFWKVLYFIFHCVLYIAHEGVAVNCRRTLFILICTILFFFFRKFISFFTFDFIDFGHIFLLFCAENERCALENIFTQIRGYIGYP